MKGFTLYFVISCGTKCLKGVWSSYPAREVSSFFQMAFMAGLYFMPRLLCVKWPGWACLYFLYLVCVSFPTGLSFLCHWLVFYRPTSSHCTIQTSLTCFKLACVCLHESQANRFALYNSSLTLPNLTVFSVLLACISQPNMFTLYNLSLIGMYPVGLCFQTHQLLKKYPTKLLTCMFPSLPLVPNWLVFLVTLACISDHTGLYFLSHWLWFPPKLHFCLTWLVF